MSDLNIPPFAWSQFECAANAWLIARGKEDMLETNRQFMADLMRMRQNSKRFHMDELVEPRGIEPLTSTMPL